MDFSSQIVRKCASNIPPSSTNYNNYKLTCRKFAPLYFRPTDSEEIINNIHYLKLKTSCRHDNVNTLLLKQIKFVISLPVSIAVNKSMETGVFPSKRLKK